MRKSVFWAVTVLFATLAVARADDRPSTRVGTFRDIPAFPSTILGNTRPVMVFLPPSYEREPGRRYPVLYAQDAQNLFDERGSFIGQEWHLDETLLRLWQERKMPEIIAVGVGNTGATRMSEYMPGESGDRYIGFLATELKPYIDNRFRTRRGPADTALMGSSMGALISVWGVLTRPDVFRLAAGLSPSVQFREPIEARWKEKPSRNIRIYLDMGSAEVEGPAAERLLGEFREMVDALKPAGAEAGSFEARVIPGARHNEPSWSARLEAPLRFLFPVDDAVKP